MYNMYGFGKRISSYRKNLGLTQEDLAAKLNITAQAVSKWENELSFPEIIMLPQLAEELNTTIEKLFGNEKDYINNVSEKENNEPKFPVDKGMGLKLAHTLGNIGCYSQKEVDVTSEDSVIFKDGSSADLKQLKVINKGPGEICFEFIDLIPVYKNIDTSKTELHEVFDKIHSIEISANGADFSVVKSKDNRTYLDVSGSPVFMFKLNISDKEGVLSVKCDQENNGGGSQNPGNKVVIALGNEYGKKIHAGINGHGSVDVTIPFKIGHLSVNGSGAIKTTDVDELKGTINGSGNIKCGKSISASVGINGSGDIDLDKVSGDFKSTINGSGDITIISGEADMFEATIRGSGDIRASEVTTRKASIALNGSGEVTIGRVIEESIEKHCKGSSIKILKRGE
jgi:transcriptional regulator with XRE-family HTH domain